MPFERIGYRRLYDAIGCSIANQEAIDISFPVGEHLQVRVYISPKPIHGIVVIDKEVADYKVTSGFDKRWKTSYYEDATQSGYVGTFFTEIIISCNVEVSAELLEAFHRRDTTAASKIFRLAETREDFHATADLISGIIGLRFHKQLVLKLLNEHFLAFIENKGVAMMMWSKGSELLGPVLLKKTDTEAIKAQFPLRNELEKKFSPLQVNIFRWLLRAWSEHDRVSEFYAFFITLEMILSGIRGDLPEEFLIQVQTLQNFIATYGGEKQKQLTAYLDAIVNKVRPSLVDRFEALAKEANMPNWQNDVEAFKKFNRFRNNLFHRGDSNVSSRVEVSKQELRFLEDLAERYINYVFFGDTLAYESQLRYKPRKDHLIDI